MIVTSKEPVTFRTGCAIERDYIYLSAKPNKLDSEDEFSRMFFYDAQNATNPWVHHDLPDWTVVSICVASASDGGARKYVALSKNGEIEFIWPGGSALTSIPGAGLKDIKKDIFGYTNCIREIGSKLHVCGSGGQVYRQEGDGWVHIAESLKVDAGQSSLDNLGRHDFAGIDGYGLNDVYVAGGSGEIWHFDGKDWTRCKTGTTEILTGIHCAGGHDVWACGFNGVVLHGNVRDGFEDVSSYDDNMNFASIVRFNGVSYVGSNEGLFIFDDKSGRMQRVAAELVETSLALDAKGGVLWSFGYDDIVSFDGTDWVKLDHPDNA